MVLGVECTAIASPDPQRLARWYVREARYIFARRSKVATRAIGIADVLTPVQVRVFSDCEMRWFYEHLLAVPDPPTASMALDAAIRAALITNFRHKLQCKEDLQTEAVVELFRRAWQLSQNISDGSEPNYANLFLPAFFALAHRRLMLRASRLLPAAVMVRSFGAVGSFGGCRAALSAILRNATSQSQD